MQNCRVIQRYYDNDNDHDNVPSHARLCHDQRRDELLQACPVRDQPELLRLGWHARPVQDRGGPLANSASEMILAGDNFTSIMAAME